jgi:hypothetical protein
MILSHYQAGTGAVLISTREEQRALSEIVACLPEDAEFCTVAAPGGNLRNYRTGRQEKELGITNGYKWAAEQPGRVLVVYDWHMMVNNPGAWRQLLEALPGLRNPGDPDEKNKFASLVCFIAPDWELKPENPLRGLLPKLSLTPPGRESIRETAEKLHPLNGNAEQVIDALCGLSADAIEQACAEVLARTGGKYDHVALRDARKQLLKEAGLEIWSPVAEIGGLGGLKDYIEQELLPWVRDDQLACKRILCAGLPGTGKSFFSKWLAYRVGCEVCRLSIPQLKSGTVGSSEANLRRALGTIDAIAKNSPLVVVIDEIDTIARDGLDGGTSSGMFAELLTWLEESKNTSQAIVVATLNRLDKLDAALESRFEARMFFDLPTLSERLSVAEIWFKHFRCESPNDSAKILAQETEGFSSREIAQNLVPSIAKLSKREPNAKIIREVSGSSTPASKTQEKQLGEMRTAAITLRRANDPIENSPPMAKTGQRRINKV